MFIYSFPKFLHLWSLFMASRSHGTFATHVFNTCHFISAISPTLSPERTSFKYIYFASIFANEAKINMPKPCPLECRRDLMPTLLIQSVHPSSRSWKWNWLRRWDRCAGGASTSWKRAGNNISWQAPLTYYRVTFRYQVEGSGSWHGTPGAAYYSAPSGKCRPEEATLRSSDLFCPVSEKVLPAAKEYPLVLPAIIQVKQQNTRSWH